MKSLVFLLLSALPYSSTLPTFNTIETLKSESRILEPYGQVNFYSCNPNNISYFKVLINPVSGTPPTTLYRFEDGVLIGSTTYSGTAYPSAVSKTATNVEFRYLIGTSYAPYASANVATLLNGTVCDND